MYYYLIIIIALALCSCASIGRMDSQEKYDARALKKINIAKYELDSYKLHFEDILNAEIQGRVLSVEDEINLKSKIKPTIESLERKLKGVESAYERNPFAHVSVYAHDAPWCVFWVAKETSHPYYGKSPKKLQKSNFYLSKKMDKKYEKIQAAKNILQEKKDWYIKKNNSRYYINNIERDIIMLTRHQNRILLKKGKEKVFLPDISK